MHPRNPYANEPPSFSVLADAVPAFRPFITLNAKGGVTINFKDPDALRALTCALLQRDFRLTVQLSADRLCPAIPGRLDYILFLQDLVRADRAKLRLVGQACPGEIVGLDVGVGASAVYPLLFCRVDDDVRMYGSDVDDASLHAAQANVDLNQLENRVKIVQSTSTAPFFAQVLEEASQLDFTMCNPPFYASAEEMEKLAEEKEFSPHAVCTGSPAEMVTNGGEAAFVSRMADESVSVGKRIRWFSSLLGKASSVKHIVEKLAELGCTNYAVVEFQQGYTQRWAIAWSFTDSRLPDEVSRQLPPSPLIKSLPLPNTLAYVCPPALSVETAQTTLVALLAELDIFTSLHEGKIVVRAKDIIWSRAARRAKQRGEPTPSAAGQSIILTCSVVVRQHVAAQDSMDQAASELICTWLQGSDRHAFESFFGYLMRKLAATRQ